MTLEKGSALTLDTVSSVSGDNETAQTLEMNQEVTNDNESLNNDEKLESIKSDQDTFNSNSEEDSPTDSEHEITDIIEDSDDLSDNFSDQEQSEDEETFKQQAPKGSDVEKIIDNILSFFEKKQNIILKPKDLISTDISEVRIFWAGASTAGLLNLVLLILIIMTELKLNPKETHVLLLTPQIKDPFDRGFPLPHIAFVYKNGSIWDTSLTDGMTTFVKKLPVGVYHGYSDAQGVLYFLDWKLKRPLTQIHSSYNLGFMTQDLKFPRSQWKKLLAKRTSKYLLSFECSQLRMFSGSRVLSFELSQL